MKIKTVLTSLVLLLAFSGVSFAQETLHYDVVAEFISELGNTKNLQDNAKIELAQTEKLEEFEKSQQAMSNAIRNSTRAILKLRESNFMLKNMKLEKLFETLLPAMIA